MLPGSLRRAVFSANLICNLINMFTEGENITKYFSKTLRGCDAVHSCRVNASWAAFADRENTPCFVGAGRGAYWGAGETPSMWVVGDGLPHLSPSLAPHLQRSVLLHSHAHGLVVASSLLWLTLMPAFSQACVSCPVRLERFIS